MMSVFKQILAVAIMVPTSAWAEDLCSPQVNALERSLAAVPHYVQLTAPHQAIALPKGAGAQEVKHVGTVIEVKDDHYQVGTVRGSVDSLTGLIDHLKAVLRTQEAVKANPGPFYLRVDKTQSMQRVLPMLCAVQGSGIALLLLEHERYGHTLNYQPPKAPLHLQGVLNQLEGIGGVVERAQALTGLITQAIGSCDTLTKSLGELGKVSPEARRKSLSKVVSKGLKGCRCEGADVPALEQFLIRMIAPSQPRAYAAPMTLQCGGSEAEVMRLPQDATVQAWVEATRGRAGAYRIQFSK